MMRANRGVGLAATQVGVLRRLIVVDGGEGPRVLVNPRVKAASGSVVDWEGCLSFPGLLAEVERAEKVTVEATDLEGRPAWIEAEGFFSRALQHEIDHLDGVVILDRARSVRRVEPEENGEEGLEDGDDEDLEDRETGRPGNGPRLRVAFLGTPDFAAVTLEAIAASRHRLVGVVTQPDRPAGRGGRSRPPAVKTVAERLGLPVWQATAGEVRSELARVLSDWEVDVAVVVAFGVILPTDVLKTPRLGCINLHASLLPDYRGAAPVHRALLDGCAVTGVTVIQMNAGVDTGDIIAQREVTVSESDTSGTVHDRLAAVGANLVVHVLDLLAAGRAVRRPQPPAGKLAPKLGPEDEVIDWTRPGEAIARQVRALDPAPGAHTVLGDRRVKVWGAEVAAAGAGSWPGPADGRQAGSGPARPGTVVGFSDGCPVVATGRGALVLTVLQPAGGSRMPGPDFANGYRMRVGEVFGPKA